MKVRHDARAKSAHQPSTTGPDPTLLCDVHLLSHYFEACWLDTLMYMYLYILQYCIDDVSTKQFISNSHILCSVCVSFSCI